jgi:hypothetical protein
MSLQLSANPAKTKLSTAVSKQNWRPTQATHRHRQISRLRRGSLAKPDFTHDVGLKEWLIVSAPGSSVDSVSAGFADSGCGTPLDSTFQNNSTWAVKAIVPQIMGILGLTSNFSNDKDAKVTLSTGKACNRKLLQVKAVQYFTSHAHEDTYGVRDAYDGKRLTLVLEDLVITSFDFAISSKGDLKAGLEAKLTQDPTGHFGNDSSFSFSLEKKGSNEFHLKSSTPLIVGFLAESNHNAPVGQGVGPGMMQPWDGWEPTAVSLPKR